MTPDLESRHLIKINRLLYYDVARLLFTPNEGEACRTGKHGGGFL